MLILVHNHGVEVPFYWVTSGFPLIPRRTSLKGQVKYSYAVGCFEKRVKAESSNVSYTLFFTSIKHFSGEIFLKPMLMYDQEIVKIQKMRKQRYFASTKHVYGSLSFKIVTQYVL